MDARLLETNLSAFFDILLTLTRDSTPQDFDKLGPYLSENVVAYPHSMREHLQPSKGRSEAIQGFRNTVNKCSLLQRRVLSQTVDVQSRKIFCEMKNKLNVEGVVVLDPLYETAAVEFDEHGKITNWKIYRCLSPVAALRQKVRDDYQAYANVDNVIETLQLGEALKAAGCCT